MRTTTPSSRTPTRLYGTMLVFQFPRASGQSVRCLPMAPSHYQSTPTKLSTRITCPLNVPYSRSSSPYQRPKRRILQLSEKPSCWGTIDLSATRSRVSFSFLPLPPTLLCPSLPKRTNWPKEAEADPLIILSTWRWSRPHNHHDTNLISHRQHYSESTDPRPPCRPSPPPALTKRAS